MGGWYDKFRRPENKLHPLLTYFFLCHSNSLRSKIPDPIPREIEGKPFSNPPTDPLHPHTVQPRTKIGGHDSMSMHPQARSQSERPDPAGASRTGGAPLRKFTGTSLPNSKVSGRLINRLDCSQSSIFPRWPPLTVRRAIFLRSHEKVGTVNSQII